MGERNESSVPMLERPYACAYDAQPTGTAGVRTGHLRIRRHPVVLCRHALLRREKRKHGT